ncbi:hypothetical protein DdX_20313 [Ditylenchus destructor]|uniref:Nuclease HARBI1 n=1 Tax=Ditylenchus destructor TaxID=166010 RepID=A0AAD4QWM9_9BILA|nr:hypothetical protein DdX_20313 [Ditylenchus destructor]
MALTQNQKLLLLLWARKRRQQRRNPRRWGIHPINRQRAKFGEYHHLFQQMKQHPEQFFRYVRMTLPTIEVNAHNAIETSDCVSDLIVKAICCLHNFLIDQKSLNPGALADTRFSYEDNDAWRTLVPDPLRFAQVRSKKANHSRNNALKVQNVLIEYFNSAGIVDRQENMI